MASKPIKKLGKLSLSILENFVSGYLGDSFIKELRDTYDEKTRIEQVLSATEERFILEFPDRELSQAMFVDLSQKDRPELSVAINEFYQHPSSDLTFNLELCKILFTEFKFLSRERIEKATKKYIDILIEELADQDENFRNKVLFLLAYRSRDSIVDNEKIRESLIDFWDFIEDKSKDFVGRNSLFQKIDNFITSYSRGYFFITGEPGIGKTSFLAKLIQQNVYIHHFNSRTEGRTTPQKFYGNVCAQLILKYSLDYKIFPDKGTDDFSFLVRLLKEVVQKKGSGTKIIIVVDALDEVQHPEMLDGANALFLPKSLPDSVYIIATARQDPKWNIECEYEVFEIEKKSIENQQDVENYLLIKSEIKGIQKYLANQNLNKAEFVKIMQDKSEGNFMYLRYVIPELAATSGAYIYLDLMALPQGLLNYYEDHWKRIKGKDTQIWFDYKLPIIMALSVSESPMSIKLISQISEISETVISEVITEWRQFLTLDKMTYSYETITRYRFYHLSFIDFLHDKEQVAAERVSFIQARKNILNFFIEKNRGHFR